MRAEIQGANEFISWNKKFADKKGWNDKTEKIVQMTTALIKQYAPVDTGRLEGSIYYIKMGNGFTIFVDIEYAAFMEWGTRYFEVGSPEHPKHRTSKSGKVCYAPFIRPAVWKALKSAGKVYAKQTLVKID